MGVLLEAKGLCKAFGKSNQMKTLVLNKVDLSIEEGEFVAVMGQSGSGKSTLLYNISGMDRMTSGEVNFNGKDLGKLTEEKMSDLRLNQMGFVFQHAHLMKNMCIKDNILLPAYKAGKRSKKMILKETDGLMKKLGIDGVGDHDITEVSGGQLQRAAICRALINYPKMLFADEPTGALNSSTTVEVMNIFNQINKEGTAILLVTHDAKVAARADRVIFFADGKIKESCKLGKYNQNKEDLKKREEHLDMWLKKMGF